MSHRGQGLKGHPAVGIGLGSAWPPPSSLPARHGAKPQGARARCGCGTHSQLGFTAQRPRERPAAPAQVSLDTGNPQRLEPGTHSSCSSPAQLHGEGTKAPLS